MLRRLALPLTLLLLASGCTSPPAPGSEDETTSATMTVTTVVGKRIEPVFTDTLHLLPHPEATTQTPDSYTDLRVPIPSIGDTPSTIVAQVSGNPVEARWQHQLPEGVAGVVGTATFWVEVRGTVVNNPNPLIEGCFWQFRFITGGADTGNSHFAPCVKENATVEEGLREITFTFDLPNVVIAPGGMLDFDLYTGDAGRAPDATVDLLTASIVHDSRVEIAGLHLEVERALLLTT